MVPETISLMQLVKQACDRGVGAVLVSDKHGKPIGIVTERDIMRQCSQQVDFEKVKAGDVMGRNLVVASPSDDINHAMDLMISKNIRHLPVVSDNGLEGIITIRDLVHAIRQSDKDEIEEFVRYLQTSMESKQTDKE